MTFHFFSLAVSAAILKRGRLGKGVQGGNAEPSERIPPPACSAKPSRKTFFSFLEEFFDGAYKIKIAKKVFLRGRQPLCGGWRLVSAGSVSWICELNLVK